MAPRGARRFGMIACVFAAALVWVQASAATTQWTKQTSPITHGAIVRVSADGASDAWGVAYDLSVGFVGTLIHWDGTSWKTPAEPVVGSKPLNVYDVEAIGPNNVWTVGVTNTKTGLPYALHWVGAKWVPMPLPTTGNGPGNELYYISAAPLPGSKDMWAVGTDDSDTHPKAAFYNGTAWKQVGVPGGSTGAWTQVAALSLKDAWTIGQSGDPAGNGGRLVAHWNGSKWTYVTDVSAYQEQSSGISSVPGTNRVWVVGNAFVKSTGEQVPFAELWNGKTWTHTAVPSPTTGGYLAAVTALSPTDAWAVGSVTNHGGEPVAVLAYHWNGETWARVAMPAPPRTAQPQLVDLAAVPSTGDVWTVGAAGSLNTAAPIIWHHSP